MEQLKHAKWQEDIARRQRALRNIDFYTNNHKPYIEKEIKRRNPSDVVDSGNETSAQFLCKYIEQDNLTEVIIDGKSVLFEEAATISMENGTKKQQEAFKDISKCLDYILAQTEIEVNTNRDVAVIPFVTTVNGKKIVKLEIITSDMAFVKQSDKDPTQADEFYYEVGTKSNSPNVAEKITLYNMWNSKGEKYRVEINSDGIEIERELIEKTINYGYMPVVMFRDYVPMQNFWKDAVNYTVEKNFQIDLLQTGVNVSQSQNIPTLVLKNYEGSDVKKGWKFVIGTKSDGAGNEGDAKYISPNAPNEEDQKLIDMRKEQVAISNKLSPAIIKGGEFTSGYHLFLSKQDLLKYTETLKKYYTEPIKQLCKVICDTWSGLAKYNFPANPEFMIDYAEIKYPESPKEKAEVRLLKTQEGTWSPVQSLMEDNPELEEKEAIERIKKTAGWNKLMQPANPFEEKEDAEG
jgi:hypothetical protein